MSVLAHAPARERCVPRCAGASPAWGSLLVADRVASPAEGARRETRRFVMWINFFGGKQRYNSSGWARRGHQSPTPSARSEQAYGQEPRASPPRGFFFGSAGCAERDGHSYSAPRTSPTPPWQRMVLRMIAMARLDLGGEMESPALESGA
jgi:hypothetical protein